LQRERAAHHHQPTGFGQDEFTALPCKPQGDGRSPQDVEYALQLFHRPAVPVRQQEPEVRIALEGTAIAFLEVQDSRDLIPVVVK
jgi:hypothetical protein